MLGGNDEFVSVTVIDDGNEKAVSLPLRSTVLKALQEAMVPIGSVCGGSMACGACHIHLDPSDPQAVAASADELCLLDDHSAHRAGRSRLACQVIVTAAMDGHAIEIAEDQ